MVTRSVQALSVGAAVWAAVTAVLVGAGNWIVPAAHTGPAPIFLILATAGAAVSAWVLSLVFQRQHGASLETRLLFGVCVAGIGLLFDGLFIGAFSGHYPLLDESRQGVLAVGLYLAYSGLLAGALAPSPSRRRRGSSVESSQHAPIPASGVR